MPSDSEVCVVFVVPDEKKEAGDAMKKAYSVTQEKRLKPKWVPLAECLILTTEKQLVFVCDDFDGPILQQLNSRKCRIIGPMCIITCLDRNMELPYMDNPVLLPAMVNLIICCTNIDQDVRNEIHRKVALMGGVISRNFTTGVTHLIAGEVGSKKYHVAASGNIPIMLPDWVDDCWSRGQVEKVHAKDECFDHLRCPVFLGVRLTVSQVDGKVRQKIREVVESNGGTYSGHMKCDETTHVVLQNAEGEKYTYARKWKLHCVNPNWVYDSVAKKYCQDEALYAVGGEDSRKANDPSPLKKASTPKQGHSNANLESMVLMNCSAVVGQPNKPFAANDKSMVEETYLTRSNGYEKLTLNTTRVAALKEDTAICIDVLQQRTDTGHFLDGSKVVLMGLNGPNLDCVRKAVNSGGGVRYNHINFEVTHVILGEMPPNLPRTLQDCSMRPHVVSLRWLVDSRAAGKPLEESPYRLISYDKLNSLDDEEKSEPPQSGCRSNRTDKSAVEVEDFADMMSQYAVEEEGAAKSSKSNLEDLIMNAVADGNRTSDAVFKGLRFKVEGFGDEDADLLAKAIVTCGGSLDPSSASDVISVVPVIGYEGAKGNKMTVSNCWLLTCAESSTLNPLKKERVFVPIESKGDQPLTGCIFSLSHYKSHVKDSLVLVGKHLGAKYEENLARFSNPKCGRLASTHLVCAVAEGKKYEGALKWKLPIVTCDWLVDCAQSGKFLPENLFAPAPLPKIVVVGTEALSSVSANSESKDLEETKSSANGQPDMLIMANRKTRLNQSEVAATTTPDRSFIIPDLKTPRLYYEAWMAEKEAKGDCGENDQSAVKIGKGRKERTFMNLLDESVSPPRSAYTSEGAYRWEPRKNVRDKLGLKLEQKFKAVIKNVFGSEENLSWDMAEKPSKEGAEMVHKQMDDMLAAAKINRIKSDEDIFKNACVDLTLDITEHRKSAPRPVQEPSQAATVTWDDPTSRMEREKLHDELHRDSQIDCHREDKAPETEPAEIVEVPEKPSFMFSSLSTEDRKTYRKTVEDLGGTVSDSENFNPACTHLVIGSLMRSEKLLGAIAAGLWVLRKNYLVECRNAGKFLPEDGFAWRPDDCSQGSRAEVLAKAATRWRLDVRDGQKTTGEDVFPFSGWRALVCTTDQRKKSFSRLLKAGGATVLDYKSPFTDVEDVSHAFLEPSQMPNAAVDIETLVGNGVLCLQVEYIGVYLLEENQPPEGTYLIQPENTANM